MLVDAAVVDGAVGVGAEQQVGGGRGGGEQEDEAQRCEQRGRRAKGTGGHPAGIVCAAR